MREKAGRRQGRLQVTPAGSLTRWQGGGVCSWRRLPLTTSTCAPRMLFQLSEFSWGLQGSVRPWQISRLTAGGPRGPQVSGGALGHGGRRAWARVSAWLPVPPVAMAPGSVSLPQEVSFGSSSCPVNILCLSSGWLRRPLLPAALGAQLSSCSPCLGTHLWAWPRVWLGVGRPTHSQGGDGTALSL